MTRSWVSDDEKLVVDTSNSNTRNLKPIMKAIKIIFQSMLMIALALKEKVVTR